MNYVKRFLELVCVTVFALGIVSCSSPAGSSNDDPKTDPSSAAKYISISPESTTYSLTGLDNNTIYIMKYNPTDDIIVAADTGYVTGTSVPSSSIAKTGSALSVPALSASAAGNTISGIYSNGFVRYDKREAQEFNANPPLFGAKVDSASKSQNALSPSLSYEAGATMYFWVQKKDDTWQQVPATLRAVGTYCYVWIVDANYDDTSTDDTDELLTTAEAESVAANFDLVYPKETAVFGAKYSAADVKYSNLVSG